jgi:phosphoglycolate phosphatase
MEIEDVVFDLDGTLIDSAPGILASLESAFESCGLVPGEPLTATLIGPPLMATLERLAGAAHAGDLPRLADAFKANYDDRGYRETIAFPGVAEMLGEASRRGYRLYIATNKRIFPTRRIVEFLGWGSLFAGIYALDSFDPPLQSKTLLLAEVLVRLQGGAGRTLYVGDRHEDGLAAAVNRVEFLLAAWGYGASLNGNWRQLDRPDCLFDALGRG